MSGNTTHGFDLAVEFSERFFNRFLGVTLDSSTGSGDSSLLCQALNAMGAGGLCGAFTVDVLMDRPADVTIPAGENDLLDIRISLAGGQLRLVVGLTIDRSLPDADVILIDFSDRLFVARASFAGIPIPDALVRSTITSSFGRIPLPSIPLPNGRTSTSPTDLIRADTRIIDDRAAADRDAWALLLTFGGGTPGNLTAFTEGFIPPGGNGAIAIFFSWLCRIISPEVARALAIPLDAFTGCSLNRSVTIDADENVSLTRLDLTLEDDFIRLTAAVSKSGFCYTATGTVSARLSIGIVGGHLIVQSVIDDPDIDISIPWECWLVAIAVGVVLGIVGGILFGVIGAIVGAIIVPLVMWIATEVIEGVIENVTGTISGQLNELEIDEDISIPGLDFIFDDVLIDDITIRAQIQVKDNTPVRGSGTIFVPDNSSIDLDKGTVGGIDLAGADLKWTGSGFGRKLETVCISSLARTAIRTFETLSRYDLYAYGYLSPNLVWINELASLNPFGWLFGDKYDESKYTYAVRTNENRYAVVRVVEVEDGYIRIQYKTFENAVTSLDITGAFKCSNSVFAPADAVAEFTPSALLRQTVLKEADVRLSAGETPLAETKVSERTYADRVMKLKAQDQMMALRTLPAAMVKELLYADLSLDQRNIGHWAADFVTNKRDFGRFTAVATGLQAPVVFQWAINGDALEVSSGTVTVAGGKRMEYTVAGNRLTLKPLDRVKFQFELKVTAIDDRTEVLVKTRCITYEPICKVRKRYIPQFTTYKETHLKYWGIVEEQPEMKRGNGISVLTHR